MATRAAEMIRVSIARDLSPRAISAQLAAFAKADKAERVAAGQFPKAHRRFVDGRENAPEESVRPDGVIAYEGNVLPRVVSYAVGFAIARSPNASGEYRHSWITLVNGGIWKRPLDDIPLGGTVTITNFAPYHRKIDVGGMKMRVPPGIVEDTRQAIFREFGRDTVSVERVFITLPGGYVLRRGRKAGQRLTYPSLIIRQA